MHPIVEHRLGTIVVAPHLEMLSTTEHLDETRRSWAEVNNAGYYFLKTELELALTFAQIAHSAIHPAKQRRNWRMALQACATVAKFRSRIEMTESQAEQLDRQLADVGGLLDSLEDG